MDRGGKKGGFEEKVWELLHEGLGKELIKSREKKGRCVLREGILAIKGKKRRFTRKEKKKTNDVYYLGKGTHRKVCWSRGEKEGLLKEKRGAPNRKEKALTNK